MNHLRLPARFSVVVMSLCVLTAAARAELRLPAIISDGMVLQQSHDVPLWGWATPDATVEITADWLDTSVTTRADQSGRWQLTIATPTAGGPHRLKIIADDEMITCQDVLIGEVWLCSGQSNMGWSFAAGVDNGDQERAAAHYPQMRLFAVKLELAPTPKEDCTGQWRPCTPKSVEHFSAVAYFFGRELVRTLDVPVGLIHSSWGGSPAEAWARREVIERVGGFEEALERLPKEFGTDSVNHNWATVLHNAMIAPLVPYALGGVIWYQGESNRSRAVQYNELFPALIRDWRTQWNQPELPFYYVQIAPYDYVDDHDYTPRLREAQRQVLRVAHTGMVVTMDIGNLNDIHPHNKQDVGRRLALWALAKNYGYPRLPHSGPLYERMEVEDGCIRLHFAHVGSGLAGRDGLAGFEIAGADGQYVPAEARIENDTVVVGSPSVAQPRAVRYAWADVAQATLFNNVGLPASPFCTDDVLAEPR